MAKQFSFTVWNESDVDIDSLQGETVVQSTAEKRKNHSGITVHVDGRQINYLFFYIGLFNALLKVCQTIDKLVNHAEELTIKETMRLYETLVRALWIVKHKNTSKSKSKLAGIMSLSTCCLVNRFCRARMKNKNSVCSHCYAGTQQRIHYGLTAHNLINGLILQNLLLPVEILAKVFGKKLANQRVFRIESFGDVENQMQVANYCRIARAVTTCRFAAWTKNVLTWFAEFDRVGKPENLVFITSSNELNKIDRWQDKAGYIDHTFTVYDHEGAEQVVITCGGRACMQDCIMKGKGCYYHNTDKDIAEELK